MSFGELLRKYVYSFRARLGASLNCVIDNIYSFNVPLQSDKVWWHPILTVYVTIERLQKGDMHDGLYKLNRQKLHVTLHRSIKIKETKTLFKLTKSLMGKKGKTILPTHSCDKTLADQFISFFTIKLTTSGLVFVLWLMNHLWRSHTSYYLKGTKQIW